MLNLAKGTLLCFVVIVIFTVNTHGLRIKHIKSTISTSPTSTVLNCSTFDPHKIKLVTFDVFAALSLLEESLTNNIHALLPQLTPDQVK